MAEKCHVQQLDNLQGMFFLGSACLEVSESMDFYCGSWEPKKIQADLVKQAINPAHWLPRLLPLQFFLSAVYPGTGGLKVWPKKI